MCTPSCVRAIAKPRARAARACRFAPVAPTSSMHLPSAQPRSFNHFSSMPTRRLWPASASMVCVSSGFDRRSIDSGRRACASSRTARTACSQSGEEHGVEGFVGGQLRHAHRRLRQDAEPPFRTEHHFAQVDAGGRRRKGRDRERAGRGFDLAAREQALDAAVAQRLLAGRARDDPAAQGRVVEGLREVAERVAVGAQLRFQVGTGDAGAEGGQLRLAVEAVSARRRRMSMHSVGARPAPSGGRRRWCRRRRESPMRHCAAA